MKVIGIDPGLTGAIAYIDTVTMQSWVEDMPVYKVAGKSKVRSVVDANQLADIISDARDGATFGATHLVLERVASMPGQGVATVFSLGDTYGRICATVEMLGGMDVLLAEPRVWKREMGLDSDKGKSLVMARQLFPNRDPDLTLAKDHNRAEALLLAVWMAKKAGQWHGRS